MRNIQFGAPRVRRLGDQVAEQIRRFHARAAIGWSTTLCDQRLS
jgi:hypothetical protein